MKVRWQCDFLRFDCLKLMKCPYCGSNFEIEHIINEKADELIDGCVKCECSRFPILSGILVLKENSLND
jgi:hypothetical protein